MTNEEWDSFVSLYREIWRAHADMATLRTMLKTSEIAAEQNRTDVATAAVRGWEARLERSRKANFYTKFLATCESHICQAQGDRSAAALIQSFSQSPPPDFPPK